jgi:oligoribonuclease
MKPNAKNLVWLDLEMTGLDPSKDHIIEIATVITNSDLEIIAEGPVMAITQPESLLAGMDAWNTKQHTRSGLVARVKESRISELDAEEATLEFIMQYVPPNKSPLCGNSICQDRRFLWKYMPALEKYFHYRNLDVSTLKELAKRWAPEVYKSFKKTAKHLALADIKESIDELKHYREHFIHLVDSAPQG